MYKSDHVNTHVSIYNIKNIRNLELLRKNVGVHNSNQRIHRTWSRSVISPTPQTFKGCFLAIAAPVGGIFP